MVVYNVTMSLLKSIFCYFVFAITLLGSIVVSTSAKSSFTTKTVIQNITESIAIQVVDQKDKVEINYTITEDFLKPNSHGIFLSLPKNQDGIWTEYQLGKVESNEIINNQASQFVPKNTK